MRYAPAVLILLGIAAGPAAPLSPGSDSGVRVVNEGLRGRLVFDGRDRDRPADVGKFIVFLWDVTQERLWRKIEVFITPNVFPFASVRPDGTFELTGLLPSVPYTVEVGRSGGWFVRSALLDSQDIRDVPLLIQQPSIHSGELIITMTDTLCSVRGTVRPENPDAAEQVIILYSQREDHWKAPWRRVKTSTARPGTDFVFRGIPCGPYYLAAVPKESLAADWRNAGTLRSIIPRAQRTTLVDTAPAHHVLTAR